MFSHIPRTRPLGLLLVTVGLALPGFVAPARELRNDVVRLELCDNSGRILALSAPEDPRSLVDADAAASLWQVDFRTPDRPPLLPEAAGSFAFEEREGGSELRMVWSDFGLADAPEARVVVDAALDPGDPATLWSLSLEAFGGADVLSVRFPRVGGIAEGEAERLAAPVWMGEITDRPRELLNRDGRPGRLEWSYPGILSMQCLAYYNDSGVGLYAACDDSASYGKRFALFGDGSGGVGFEVVQLPEAGADSGAYASPYRVLLGPLHGDWFTAAERYRGWALEQSWARESRLRGGGTPDWTRDVGLWVWNRGRSSEALEPAGALQAVAGVPVAVFWHWWHGCAYDVGFPEYLPPREGSDPFARAVEAAHRQGLHAIVYMNQRLWGMTTQSWADRGAARYAVKGPDGAITPEVYNTFTGAPCASMCMGTSFWRDTYADLAVEAVCDLGVDGIYMDQACSSLSCYDPSHGHPLGGGAYWMQGFQLLQQGIRERCLASDRRPALAGEGCGEAWLPYLDLMLSLQVSMDRYAEPGAWQPIPFFHAVYHGYCLPFGNYASLTMPPYDELWPKETAPKDPLALLDRKFATQFRLEQARAFAWGQTPTLANFRPEHLAARSAEVDFVIRLARLRKRALDYLLNGTMLRPPRMDAVEAEIPVSRLSIYAGQQGALSEYRASRPLVVHSAWRSEQGGVAIVVVNVSDTAQHAAFALDASAWPIAHAGRVRVLECAGSERTLDYVDGTVSIDEELAPASARIYIVGEN